MQVVEYACVSYRHTLARSVGATPTRPYRAGLAPAPTVSHHPTTAIIVSGKRGSRMGMLKSRR